MMQEPKKQQSAAEVILSALEADHCVDRASAMTSERLIELCDYAYIFDEEAIENSLISLIREEQVNADVDDNDEPVFWLASPVLH